MRNQHLNGLPGSQNVPQLSAKSNKRTAKHRRSKIRSRRAATVVEATAGAHESRFRPQLERRRKGCFGAMKWRVLCPPAIWSGRQLDDGVVCVVMTRSAPSTSDIGDGWDETHPSRIGSDELDRRCRPCRSVCQARRTWICCRAVLYCTVPYCTRRGKGVREVARCQLAGSHILCSSILFITASHPFQTHLNIVRTLSSSSRRVR